MNDQATLFALDDSPQGLRYQSEFVTPGEETELVSLIQEIDVQPFQFGQYEGKRRVAWFGWQYDYSDRKLKRAEEIPSWLSGVTARVEAFDSLEPGRIKQVLVTEYEAGAGIGWHRDKPHFERVYGLSLKSPCRFRFRRKNGSRWERFTLQAQPRSLYRMAGSSRLEWEHSIPPVEELRYSVTFRTMSASA
jgi:alkylated DNA repair dioxygenase AlkB